MEDSGLCFPAHLGVGLPAKAALLRAPRRVVPWAGHCRASSAAPTSRTKQTSTACWSSDARWCTACAPDPSWPQGPLQAHVELGLGAPVCSLGQSPGLSLTLVPVRLLERPGQSCSAVSSRRAQLVWPGRPASGRCQHGRGLALCPPAGSRLTPAHGWASWLPGLSGGALSLLCRYTHPGPLEARPASRYSSDCDPLVLASPLGSQGW